MIEKHHTPTNHTDMNPIIETRFALQQARRHFDGILRAFGADIGQSYFDTHIMRVVKSVPDEMKAAAALHDYLEDPNIHGVNGSWAQLRNWVDNGHLSLETANAVHLLTRPETKDITYARYIQLIATEENPAGVIARRVKLADLADNLSTDPSSSLASHYLKATATISNSIVIRNEA